MYLNQQESAIMQCTQFFYKNLVGLINVFLEFENILHSKLINLNLQIFY